jgi:L-aminopeptidase/D-esterase-like protein
VLVVANGGILADPKGANTPRSLAPSTVSIIATSAPLLPEGLSVLAESCMSSLNRLIEWDAEDKQLALAFSTSNTIDHSFDDQFRLKPVRQYLNSHLSEISNSGAEAARAAFLRALTEAEPVTGRKGRRVERIDVSRLK